MTMKENEKSLGSSMWKPFAARRRISLKRHQFVSTSAFLTGLPVQSLAGPNVQSMLATSDKTKGKKGSKMKTHSLTLYNVPLIDNHGKRIDANIARLRLTLKILKALYVLFIT